MDQWSKCVSWGSWEAIHISRVFKWFLDILRKNIWPWGGSTDTYLGRTLTSFLVFLVAQLVKNLPAMQETLVRFLHWKVPLEKDRLAQTVKNPPAMWEIWVWSLGWEDPLEEGMASHPSILAWRIPMNRGAWWSWDHRVRHDWAHSWQVCIWAKYQEIPKL